MGFNDGSADRQANADSAGLGGVESLENAFTILRINAGPESPTATTIPFVSLCSVLIRNSRAPASTDPIASTAFRIKLKMICCT